MEIRDVEWREPCDNIVVKWRWGFFTLGTVFAAGWAIRCDEACGLCTSKPNCKHICSLPTLGHNIIKAKPSFIAFFKTWVRIKVKSMNSPLISILLNWFCETLSYEWTIYFLSRCPEKHSHCHLIWSVTALGWLHCDTAVRTFKQALAPVSLQCQDVNINFSFGL